MNNMLKKKSFTTKFFFISLLSLLVIGIASCFVMNISPWPADMLIRKAFTKNALKVNTALEKHVPPNVTALLNQQYEGTSKDGLLDVYYPSSIENTNQTLKVIVWTHGGAWVSGNKDQLSNYCKILADKGFVVVSINYSIAPGKKYPTPVRQLNAALDYLVKNAKRFHINPDAIVLAGDSGGAHIAAQEANIIAVPSYAKLMGIDPSIPRSKLIGMILYCGPYNAQNLDLNGEFGKFLKTILWAYSGKKDFMTDTAFASASVINYVNKDFPATYISVGNKDPLATQSYNFAKALMKYSVKTDTLFFPATYTPDLPHEYQFNLDNEAGQTALAQSVKFLKGL